MPMYFAKARVAALNSSSVDISLYCAELEWKSSE
jgi:hypothetical protein